MTKDSIRCGICHEQGKEHYEESLSDLSFHVESEHPEQIKDTERFGKNWVFVKIENKDVLMKEADDP